MENKNNCECSIEDVLNKPFAFHTHTEKQNIIEKGRPTPILSITTKKNLYYRHFSENIYKKNDWVAGCKYTNKIYCWPCVLFSVEKTVWNSEGYYDLNNLHKAIERHRKSQNHLKTVLELLKFEKTTRIGNKLDSLQNNKKDLSLVKKNREVIKSLIDVFCYLGYQEQTFKGNYAENESVNRGNYIELLNLLAKYNPNLCNYMETATALSNKIQNDLIRSISETIIKEIKCEIENSKFVSIIFNETTDISMKSQLSTILRYVDINGKIHERFVGYKDISEKQSTSDLFQYITEIINDFECTSKLISQSYDGTPIMSGEQNGLQKQVTNLCKDAIFIPCFAHRLNLVLTKSSSKIPQCKKFFQTITSFYNFFTHSTKRTAAFYAKANERRLKIEPTRWNFNGKLIMTIKEYRFEIEDLLEEIIENQDNKWDSESINSARGLLVVLNNYEFNFLLCIFSKIYPQTDILFDMFQTKQNDITYCKNKIKVFVGQLENLNFTAIWNLTKEHCELSDEEEKNEKSYLRMFIAILENIKEEIKLRFDTLDSIIFIELLDTTKYQIYSQKFPANLFENLQKTYPSIFDFNVLKVELTVLFNENELLNKNFVEIYNYINKNKLESSFKQFSILLNLILTMPVIYEQSLSTIDRIQAYSRNQTDEERSTNLALISIEKKLLKTLFLNNGTYDEIIKNFSKKKTDAGKNIVQG